MARWTRSTRVTFSHRVEALGLRAGIALANGVPHERALELGAWLGDLAWHAGVRRRVVLEALARADGMPADTDARVRIARDCYRNFGRTFVEYARLGGPTGPELVSRVSVDRGEYLERAIGAGRGVLAVSGHFGSLELMATAMGRFGVRPTLLVAPMRNPLANALFAERRRRYGVDVIEVGPGLRQALVVLKRGGLLCLAVDQDAGRHGVFVDFLGRPASTPAGVVELGLRSGAPVVFGLAFREPPPVGRRGGGHHVVRLRPPVDLVSRGDHDATVRYYLQLLSDWLGEGVRERPDHWFWMHRRWKTRPDSGSASTRPHGETARTRGAGDA